MNTTCSSAEITAPRSLAARVPYSAMVAVSSPNFRRVCRAVSLSADGVLVLSSQPVPKGEALRVSLLLSGDRRLDLAAVLAHESSYVGRRALDIRFVNLCQRDRLLIEGMVAQPSAWEGPRRDSAKRGPPPMPPRKPASRLASKAARAPARVARSPRRAGAISSHDEFDGLPSTDEIDSMLAKTLAELKQPESASKKKSKGRFRW